MILYLALLASSCLPRTLSCLRAAEVGSASLLAGEEVGSVAEWRAGLNWEGRLREGEAGVDGLSELLEETRRSAGPVGPRRANELIRSCASECECEWG